MSTFDEVVHPRVVREAFEQSRDFYFSTADIEPAVQSVLAAYSSSHRHYHNLRHIYVMLAFIYSQSLPDPENHELQLATLFHDFVYDPKANDNEEKSAEVAVKCLAFLNIPQEVIDRVCELILATKTHIPNQNQLSALFIDADLAILGLGDGDYSSFSDGIRKEYSFVSDEDYRIGRTKVLQSFLDRDHIYQTDSFRNRFEAQARINIGNELLSLNVDH